MHQMTTTSEQFDRMTATPIPRLIISLGIPTIISMLVTNLYNMADTYFVSQLGTSASGATGVVFALMGIIQAFGFMLGHGAGSNISRQLGAKDTEDAKRYASTSFFLSLFIGLAIMMSGLVFLTPFMYLLGSTDTILPYARTYAIFILIAAPAMASSCVMNNILRYEGKAFFAMIGLTTGSILNIFGDWLLIEVFHMGMMGAGLSTAVSQYISCSILFFMFVSGKTESKLSLKYLKWDGKLIWNIVSVGFPSMMRQGLNSVSTMLLNLQAAVYGDAAIAAMSIVARSCNLLFCVGLGMGQGFQPVSAFNYGAKKYSRVKEGFHFTLWFGTALLSLFAFLGFVFAEDVVTWFRNDPQVISIGTLAMRLQCLSLIFQPVSVTGNMLFQSIGKSGMATLLSALRSGFAFIPLVLLLPQMLGLFGIQLAQPIAEVITATLTIPCVIHFFRKLPKDGEEI